MISLQGSVITVGLDEAGRGPLAGPVIAAAVVLNPEKRINGIKDSKLLNESQRESLYKRITERAIAWAVGRADVAEIDELNILHASMLAMQRAFNALSVLPTLALVDGNYPPKLNCEVQTIVGGDGIEPAIGAASIIAKVTRDREMVQLDKLYPHYGFAKHKGYSTKQHLSALATHGVCQIHRRTYEPVARFLELASYAVPCLV